MNRCGMRLLGVFFVFLTGAMLLLPARQAAAQAKGWSEEKYLQRATGTDNRVSLPAVAADGANVYVVYRQGDIKLIVSRDQGKTWSDPVSIAPQYRINSAPAVEVIGSKVVIVWPTRIGSGEVTPYQLLTVESSDQGKSWSPPKRITQTRDSAFSPRFLVQGNGAMLLWQETPSETLGRISSGRRAELSPESVEAYETNFTGQGLKAEMSQVRSIFNIASYNPGSGAFSIPQQVDEINSRALPHVFSLFGPLNGNLFIVANQNTEIKVYSSANGQAWKPYFQQDVISLFDPRRLQDISVIDGQPVFTWVRREPFTQIPVNFATGRVESSVQLTPNQFVRSLPRYDFSQEVYHVVWESGNQEESWLTYMRTDKVLPTSEIVLPTSPEVTDRSIQFGWLGQDNISAPERLVYSFSYIENQWSKPMPDTQANVLAPKDGDYVFKVRAEDVAGNIQEPPAEFKFNTNKSAPETKITQSPDPNAVIENRTVEVAFIGDDNNDPPSSLKYSAQADSGEWTQYAQGTKHTFNNLANGDHVLRIRMQDLRGNTDLTPAECKVVVRVGLELIWEASPVVTTNSEAVNFSWSAKDDQGRPVQLQYFYTLDKNPQQDLQNNAALELASIEEGKHTVKVWGVDASGDKTPELTHSFIIDRTAPETNAMFSKEYSRNFPRINLTSEDPALPDGTVTARPVEYEYRIGEGEWTHFTSTADSWTLSRPLAFYSWGYIVEVRALDAAGNVDATPASVDLRIFSRTNPYIFYSVVAVLVLAILYLLKLLLGRFFEGRRRPISTTATSSAFNDSLGDTGSSSSSFKFDDDDDDDLFSDKGKKKLEDEDDPYA